LEVSLAAKLKELRRRTGQSLQEVANGVGVSKAHIWELETGKSSNPGLELLRNLAEHFKVTIAFLTDEETRPEHAASLQFFRELEGELSEKDWETLRAVAERLKEKDK
jgi:transcriptional regulator with XRE-family HTH domain